MPLSRTVDLGEGLVVPRLLFSTNNDQFKKGGQELVEVILNAIHAGFRGIDTTESHAQEVGQAIREWGGKREDLFIAVTWEISGDPRGHIMDILDKMKVDYVDDYQLRENHDKGEMPLFELWQTYQEIKYDRLARTISFRDVSAEQLKELSKRWQVKPSQNRLEHDPFAAQVPRLTQARRFAEELQLPTGGYLDPESVYSHDGKPISTVLNDITSRRKLSQAQVILLWAIETCSGTVSVFTADTKAMEEYLAVLDVEHLLTESESTWIAKTGEEVAKKE